MICATPRQRIWHNLKASAFRGHMHGAVLLDKALKPLRPCILWNDTRSHAEAAQLDAHENVRTLSGNIVFPGFTAPKLVWVKANEPDIFEKTAHILLPKDFLRLYLTGELRLKFLTLRAQVGSIRVHAVGPMLC